MEGYDVKPDSVSAKGHGGDDPASKSDPAKNRRALILIHD